ncbi:MAG: bifunctional riboflavin kinase/FAD synthetase [Megasphaera massiliensis]|uniref:bifunctional riboflavin kinase/FAD synthetase n=3 Tax=Megasphaera massiliensis TaxID=1232428 RepID=UPI002A74C2C5|nr:bifunctional riboflavin kinase/FAD synthetase [Megasphaera massiliensis]MDY2966367.1 bifunctional riboflavin kinase/FAD synthetase [Megasphaera massiliensis]
MEIFHSFQEITGFTGAVVALGTFDGIHKGHQMVMKTAIKRAAAGGVKTMVVTFTAHPMSVLCPEKEPLRLATIGQKAEYIADVGIDGFVLLPMSEGLLRESPEEFCQNLVTYIHPSVIVVGSNFTYGAKAAGNTDTMKAFMADYDIPVEALTLLERPGGTTPISSTVIRRLIQMGHMETAENLLGRPFALTGTIVPGDHRGRTIGFATANMLIPINMAIPPDGVYVTELWWDGEGHPAMTNIGDNPTFENQYRRIETHVLDWDKDLYGKNVSLRFRKRLRGEEVFASADDLIAQMKEDEKATQQFFAADKNE